MKKICAGKKASPVPLFYLLDMSRGSLLPGCDYWSVVQNASEAIGRASLARENEAGGSWGQEVHILHVNI